MNDIYFKLLRKQVLRDNQLPYCEDIIMQKKIKNLQKKTRKLKTKYRELPTESGKRRAMTWAARLKRAFNIDIKTCEACNGAVKVIACIDDPVVINKILDHLYSQQSNDST